MAAQRMVHADIARLTRYAALAGLLACGSNPSPPPAAAPTAAAQPQTIDAVTPAVAVAPQYDTTHVYVAPEDVDRFATSFLATFGGKSTKQVVVTVTPTPSSTTSQLLQTPVGTVSLFGFKTPVPVPFGTERTGYLVSDLDQALSAARACGAYVIVESFPDPIGRDAVIQWPGGVNMQLYWHTTKPSYPAFQTIPDNRVYLSPDRASTFVQSFVRFAHGNVVDDDPKAPGGEIGRPNDTYRRVRVESAFGKLLVLATDGHLPYPYGHETTGYEVADLAATLAKARAAGATVLVDLHPSAGGQSALVSFPGGYMAEIHAATSSTR
jgi:predicted enzyme related to lactoylglutathione lyase